MMIRFKFLSRQAFLLFILAFWCLSAKAVKMGTEGEEWIKWTPEARVIYIRAYVTGFYQAYGIGCSRGASVISSKLSYNVESKAIAKCWSEYPFLEGDPTHFVPLITEFYTAYPEQRNFDISDVLMQASKGHSVKEIHEHFLKSLIP